MLKATRDNFIVSFPEVNERATLQLEFKKVDAPNDRVRFAARHDGSFDFERPEPLLLRLRSGLLTTGDRHDHPLHYPFAVIVSVAGVNALSGEVTPDDLTRPQNYFVTPPQGGIDGYFAGDKVHPLVAGVTRLQTALRWTSRSFQ